MARRVRRTRLGSGVIERSDLDDVEALAGWSWRRIRTLHSLDLGTRRSRTQQTLQGWKRFVRSADHHFHPSIRKVPGETGETQRPGMAGDEPPKTHPLHHARNEKTGTHAGRLRRARSASTTMGSTEIAIMARMTRVKFSRTVGMFPKKYPAGTNSPTQSTAPTTLYVMNFG